MTVCIAAICTAANQHAIIAASDRMITAEDIEFEQPQPNVFKLSAFSVSLTSGDVSAQSAIAFRANREIARLGLIDVPEIAKIYGRIFADYRREMAETDILAPLGLTSERFLQRQHEFHADFVTSVTGQLQDHRLRHRDFGRAIVTGVDDKGAHLFLVSGAGQPVSMYSIGFVAIGGGQWHAESQFMFNRYTKSWDFPRAFFLAYTAKRRAEVAPGVGKETDMFVMTINPKNLVFLDHTTEFAKELKTRYDGFEQREEDLKKTVNEEFKSYVEETLKKSQANSTTLPGTPTQPK